MMYVIANVPLGAFDENNGEENVMEVGTKKWERLM